MFRANPNAAAILKAAAKKDPTPKLVDVSALKQLCEETLADLNAFMQNYRVFCVTPNKDSDKMWTEYAENHKGIVLRIEPNLEKDSKFQKFLPVSYREKRPALYESAKSFFEDALFADQTTKNEAMLHQIIYSKTLKWKDECEYRLAIPLGQDEEPWETLSYHAEEVTEMYLGAAMTKADKDDLLAKAKKLNPAIKVFQASRSADGKITFTPQTYAKHPITFRS
jgi:hypothetical protein